MKKYMVSVCLVSLLLSLLCGCVNNSAAQFDDSSLEIPEKAVTDVEEVDVDLTILSGTMVYAEVNSIMTTPDDYFGKTIKIRGSYYASYFDETEQYYHYVLISDATACCAKGIEFIWNGEHDYPDDYPDENAIVEVVGIFGKYEELGKTYAYLTVDDVVII